MSGRQGAALVSGARVLLVALLSCALLAVGWSPPVQAAAGPRASAQVASADAPGAAPTAATPTLTVRLASMTPTVATPGKPVTAKVSVRNTTSQAVTGLVVQARVGAPGSVVSRDQVRTWASGPGRATDPVAATTPVTGTLAPGGEVLVSVTLPPQPSSGVAFGSRPLTLHATGTSTSGRSLVRVSGARASFVPFVARKEYEQLSIAFAAPLTLDPDPSLVTATGTARAEAWQRQLGQGSRLDRIVTATTVPGARAGAASTTPVPVTWAVDPTIVGASPPADAVAAPPARSQTTRGSPPEPDATQGAFARRLAALTPGRDVWALPPADPDLVAVTRGGLPSPMLRTIVGPATPLAQRLGLIGAARVAWPVGGPLRSGERAALDGAFGGSGPAAYLAPGSSVDENPQLNGTAARHTDAGRPLLAYDDELSRLFTVGSSTVTTPGESAERFLAETTALLAQSPGRRRSVLVVAGRDFDPDPSRTQALLTAVSQAPWLAPRPASDLITSASEPDSPVATTYRDSGDPLSPGRSPIDEAQATEVAAAQADVDGLAHVLSATPSSTLVPDTATIRALLSARWRGAVPAWSQANDTVRGRLTALTNGVSVVPSTVNFFAEHGILQVTVVNNLDVEVHDVRLVVGPQGRPPRLRLTQEPAPLRISPKSRTTVRLQVEAVAAGVVPVSAHLATPSGTRLGTDATVRVSVRPTNGWVMLALGGLIGVVFLAGLYRALRAGSPRVSSEDLKEIDLE